MNKTNLGVQLFPIALLVLSYLYYVDARLVLSSFTCLLSLLMWVVLWADNFNTRK